MSSLKSKGTFACLAFALVGLCACDEEPKHEATSKKAAKPKPVAQPKAAETVVKKKKKKPSHPCPEGSEGEGTFDKPCVATGATRMMQVDWNRRPLKEKGPTFRVINNSDLEVLFGKVVVYFYDKAGKQLEVETASGKKKPYLSCSGSIFAGPVNPKEKVFLNFSCSPQKRVPDNAVSYEAEMAMVGYTSKTEKRADTFWRNDDLVPDKRPKGGIKGKK